MFDIYTTETAKNAERFQSDQLGRRLPLAGTDYNNSAAPFDGGRVS